MALKLILRRSRLNLTTTVWSNGASVALTLLHQAEVLALRK